MKKGVKKITYAKLGFVLGLAVFILLILVKIPVYLQGECIMEGNVILNCFPISFLEAYNSYASYPFESLLKIVSFPIMPMKVTLYLLNAPLFLKFISDLISLAVSYFLIGLVLDLITKRISRKKA